MSSSSLSSKLHVEKLIFSAISVAKKATPCGSGSNVSFNIYLLPEHAGVGGHFGSLGQGNGQFFGLQLLGSQSFGSQFFTSQTLSFLHSVLAFFLAFFFPPPFVAEADKDNRLTASIATSNFFIL